MTRHIEQLSTRTPVAYYEQLSTRYSNPAPVEYQVEVRSTSGAYAPTFSRGSKPVVVFVRGYQGMERVYAQTVGFADGRRTTPTSRQARLLREAELRVRALRRKEYFRQRWINRREGRQA